MINPHELYQAIGHELNDMRGGVTLSKMFGEECLKVNGKVFACYFQEAMVFKLPGESYCTALALGGARLFDPTGANRPMKEWVQVPADHHALWEDFAKVALEYVVTKK
jgi:TfoX/Sxy family transcriptional regulator of competence genes